jgi:hypothetical protein
MPTTVPGPETKERVAAGMSGIKRDGRRSVRYVKMDKGRDELGWIAVYCQCQNSQIQGRRNIAQSGGRSGL